MKAALGGTSCAVGDSVPIRMGGKVKGEHGVSLEVLRLYVGGSSIHGRRGVVRLNHSVVSLETVRVDSRSVRWLEARSMSRWLESGQK